MTTRAYSARITALIADVSPKWLDNLLSRHDLPGVSKSRQGVERRISEEGLVAVELCRMLNLELGVSLRQAVAVTSSCMHHAAAADSLRFTTASGLSLDFPIGAIRSRLRTRMTYAAEMLAVARRGRPSGADKKGHSRNMRMPT